MICFLIQGKPKIHMNISIQENGKEADRKSELCGSKYIKHFISLGVDPLSLLMYAV
jgi:hypothetical protein